MPPLVRAHRRTMVGTCHPANHLLSISATNNLTTVNFFAYALDTTGRRTRREDADGSRTGLC
jgi:hypothetical protein